MEVIVSLFGSRVGKVNDFTYEDLLSLADNHGIKQSKAVEIVNTITEVVSRFEQRAKELTIRKDLVALVSHDVRLITPP